MNDLPDKIRDYFSTTGSFSRGELAVACVVLAGIWYAMTSLAGSRPDLLPPGIAGWLSLGLYGLWGVALGKRSRDLGTTFTYGVVIGVLFPVIGVVFLCQAGAKARAAASLPQVDRADDAG